MGYRCKVCVTYQKDHEGAGWEAMGWKSDEWCGDCTDDDLALVATNPFVAKLRERVEEMGEERYRMIVRFQKQAYMRKQKHCTSCTELTGRLASVTTELAKARREKEKVYEQLAETLLANTLPKVMGP